MLERDGLEPRDAVREARDSWRDRRGTPRAREADRIDARALAFERRDEARFRRVETTHRALDPAARRSGTEMRRPRPPSWPSGAWSAFMTNEPVPGWFDPCAARNPSGRETTRPSRASSWKPPFRLAARETRARKACHPLLDLQVRPDDGRGDQREVFIACEWCTHPSPIHPDPS